MGSGLFNLPEEIEEGRHLLARAKPFPISKSKGVKSGQALGAGGEARAAGEPPVPSLSISNNCIKGINVLQGAHKRTAEVITLEIQALAKAYGIERLGFLTLTFADNVQEVKEASRRFHSLATNVLQSKYRASIWTKERQRSGRLHYHGVVVCPEDIRMGVDFVDIARGVYASAGPFLRQQWAFWRVTAPKYGFGRTELLPVKSTAEGIARYVGKYISKHIDQRQERDKGARLVNFVGYKPGDRKASVIFSYNSVNGWLWRRKLEAFCLQNETTMPELKKMFGPRWCFYLQGAILDTKLNQTTGEFTYPSVWHAIADKEEPPDDLQGDWADISVTTKAFYARNVVMPDIPGREQALEDTWREWQEIKGNSRRKQCRKDFDEVIQDWNKHNENNRIDK